MSRHPASDARTILIVDDEPSVCKLLKGALRKKGRNVLSASSGQRAVSIALHRKVDVVVLDLRMTGWSGLETLQHLLEVDAGLVVIVLTGYGSVDTAREAMRRGAYDYLTKPFAPAFLEEVIDDSLHQKQKIAGRMER